MSFGKPIFFYDNLLKKYAVTVTSEATDYPKENLFDDMLQSLWKASTAAADQTITIDAGSAVSVDVFCLGDNNNLNAIGATIKLQYSTTGAWGGEEVDAFTAFTAAAGEHQYKLFTGISARYWRVYIAVSSGTPQIGEVAFGARYTLPRWFKDGFDDRRKKVEGKTNISDGGQRESITKHKRRVFPCALKNIFLNTQAETDYFAWKDAVEEGMPFWFLWDVTGSYQVCFVNLKERELGAPIRGNRRSVSFTLQEEL